MQEDAIGQGRQSMGGWKPTRANTQSRPLTRKVERELLPQQVVRLLLEPHPLDVGQICCVQGEVTGEQTPAPERNWLTHIRIRVSTERRSSRDERRAALRGGVLANPSTSTNCHTVTQYGLHIPEKPGQMASLGVPRTS